MSGQDLNRPLHLRPMNDEGVVLRINLRQMRVRFESGRKFVAADGNRMTIHDIPEGTPVILYNRRQQKLHLRVIPVQ